MRADPGAGSTAAPGGGGLTGVVPVLLLVRHGEATANAAGLLLGRSDPELTERGRDQAREVAPYLGPVARCVSSPLRRAMDSAALWALGLPIEVDQRWIERDYGDEEGVPYRSLHTPGGAMTSKWADLAYRPSGGETLTEVAARVAGACAELFADEGKGARSDDGDVVVVSHVSPIKAAVAWALGAADDIVWRLHLSTGSITRIGWSANLPQLITYNWTARR